MTRLSEIRERHAAAIRRANETHVVDSRDDDIELLLNEIAWLLWVDEYVRRDMGKEAK